MHTLLNRLVEHVHTRSSGDGARRSNHSVPHTILGLVTVPYLFPVYSTRLTRERNFRCHAVFMLSGEVAAWFRCVMLFCGYGCSSCSSLMPLLLVLTAEYLTAGTITAFASLMHGLQHVAAPKRGLRVNRSVLRSLTQPHITRSCICTSAELLLFYAPAPPSIPTQLLARARLNPETLTTSQTLQPQAPRGPPRQCGARLHVQSR